MGERYFYSIDLQLFPIDGDAVKETSAFIGGINTVQLPCTADIVQKFVNCLAGDLQTELRNATAEELSELLELAAYVQHRGDLPHLICLELRRKRGAAEPRRRVEIGKKEEEAASAAEP